MVMLYLLCIFSPFSVTAPPAHPFVEGRQDFVFQIQDNHIGHATGDVLRQFADETRLGSALSTTTMDGREFLRAKDGRPVASIDEWGYSAIKLSGTEIDGAGLPRAGFPCFSSLQGCEDPTTREEALARLKSYYAARQAHQAPENAYVISMNGHYYFQHYAGEWGADLLMSEVGENINGTQAHIAFTRGAARQFRSPWGMDMSAWYGAGVNDYWAEEDRVWCQQRNADGACAVWHSGPDHGHSISLFERIYFTSYMAGAHYLKAEAGSINLVASKHPPAALSPLGEMARDFHAFTQAHPDRGTPYVPYAIILDYHHGLGLGSWYKPAGEEKAFEVLPMGDADRCTLQLLEAFWPNAFRVQGGDESQYLVPTPFGDTSDVLLENAPVEAFLAYDFLFLSGDIEAASELTERLKAFLGTGKTIVLSPNHGAIFSTLDAGPANPIGALPPTVAIQSPAHGGTIIELMDAAQWPALLKHLHQTAQPFSFTGDPIHYLLNRRGDTWIITLINDLGITKQPKSAAVVDPAQRATVTLSSTSARITSCTKINEVPMALKPLSPSGQTLQLKPGQIAVLMVEVASGSS